MPDVHIELPKLHEGQLKIFNSRGRLNAVDCGRRFGKTKFMVWLASRRAISGGKFGIFAPEHKQLLEPWAEIKDILQPIISTSNKNEGTIRTITGGQIDFWPLIDNELAGRGREYDEVAGDEVAFAKDGQMTQIWERSIKPTMLTTRGTAWMFSTPNGVKADNFFYQICNEPTDDWVFHHAPTRNNPFVPLDELEKEKRINHELVWKQEFLAEFVSWDSATFFKLDYLLDNGKPIPYPEKTGAIFAVMDCAVKSGTDNDATAVVYFAYNQFYGAPLTILDYEMHSIDAAYLEHLAPAVLQKCEDFATQLKARNGSIGLLVEDAAGGSFLLQQAYAKAWPIRAIDSSLMMKGKDERAMIAGGPVYQGLCKLSEHAFDKVVDWKGRTANHLINQVTGFRIGDKDAYRRADDLLDCFTYGVAVALSDYKAL